MRRKQREREREGEGDTLFNNNQDDNAIVCKESRESDQYFIFLRYADG